MSVDSSVDFSHFAASTEGYSGADLQALVYNAHLESVHEIFTNDSASLNQSSDTTAEYIVLRSNSKQALSKADSAAANARVSCNQCSGIRV